MPLVQLQCEQGIEQGDEAGKGVVRQRRIGDVPLSALDPQRAVEAAAPADLHHLAQLVGVGRLAHQASVERLPSIGEPVQHLARAVDRRPLLIAGNQQADGARAGTGNTEARHGSDESRDCALHVARAAPVEHTVFDLGGEGLAGPACAVARGHNVGMAREAEVGRACAPPRVEVIDPRSARLLEGQAMAGEAQRLERSLEHVEGAAVRRRDALAADQRARERQRMRERFSARQVLRARPTQLRSSSLIEVLARVPASTRLTITAQ